MKYKVVEICVTFLTSPSLSSIDLESKSYDHYAPTRFMFDSIHKFEFVLVLDQCLRQLSLIMLTQNLNLRR
jgi:hypothetical protein